MYESKDVLENYGFHFLDNVHPPAVELVSVGREQRYSNEYYWDNKDRKPSFLFQYTLRGSGTLITKDKVQILKKGSAFFLKMPVDCTYCFDENTNEAPWEFIYLHFKGDAAVPYYNYIVERLGTVMKLPEFHPAVTALFELHRKAKNGAVTNSFMADSEVFRFLCLLCDGGANLAKHSSLLIERTKEYLEKNYEKQITLALVSDVLGVSQSHLSREFIKHTGEQPIRYLTKIRLERAVEMLVSTNLNLETVSDVCGFASSNYFCKVFKKYMKTSPGDFRKQMKILGYARVKL